MRKLIFLILVLPYIANAGDSVYVRTLASKKCSISLNQQIECIYTLGKDLKFVIAGIGTEYTSITFLSSSFDGDFYGSVGIKHGCVIVQAGQKTIKSDGSMHGQYAFVSPKNGKVYNDWIECKTAQ
jgi:hypothetical protein